MVSTRDAQDGPGLRAAVNAPQLHVGHSEPESLDLELGESDEVGLGVAIGESDAKECMSDLLDDLL